MTTSNHPIYRGEIQCKWIRAVTVDGEPLDPARHLMDHSPFFSWGDDSLLSVQLALAILAHHLDDPLQAVARHRRFHHEVIAQLRPDVNFSLPAAYIEGWLAGTALLPGETERTRGKCQA